MRIHPLATLAAAFMFAVAHAATTVPENLRPAPNETLTLETKATGVQIYTCGASKDNPTRYEWTFKAPEAELFDPSGARVDRHEGIPGRQREDEAAAAVHKLGESVDGLGGFGVLRTLIDFVNRERPAQSGLGLRPLL